MHYKLICIYTKSLFANVLHYYTPWFYWLPFLSKKIEMTKVYHTEPKNQFIFTNIKRKYFLSFFFDVRSNGRITIHLGELKHWINDYWTKAKKVLQKYGNVPIHLQDWLAITWLYYTIFRLNVVIDRLKNQKYPLS